MTRSAAGKWEYSKKTREWTYIRNRDGKKCMVIDDDLLEHSGPQLIWVRGEFKLSNVDQEYHNRCVARRALEGEK